jgi:5-methylcytosine-specific restriction enzyme subunit McrC
MTSPAVITLREYQSHPVSREILSEAAAREVIRRWPTDVSIRPDWNGTHWEVTAGGVVGHLPVDATVALSIQPKIPMANLFGMLEIAYRAEIKFFDHNMTCNSLREFYDRLASVLAKRVLGRARRGLYRSYISEEENLCYIRGSIDRQEFLRPRTSAALRCHYQEHTGDIEDNQILVWTLSRIARSGLCGPAALSQVRAAFRVTRGAARSIPFEPADCVKRLYNRLNLDYGPMHGLCRFFLEHTGPSFVYGDHVMVPFKIDMARLYELFVAEWLRAHLPPEYRLGVQEHVVASDGVLRCSIDLVIYSLLDDAPLCVLDTKYKDTNRPAETDIYQVNAYADLKGCARAFLVYPTTQIRPGTISFANKRIECLSFCIDGDLDAAGAAFLLQLLEAIGN